MTYTYSVEVPLERGAHSISAQVTNIWQVLQSSPLAFASAYDLTEHGIDLYQGDKRLDAWDVRVQDTLVPDLPTLTFTCADELGGTVDVVIRERGLRRYAFSIRWVDLRGGVFTYQCVSRDLYALSVPFQKLQVPYSTTLDLIGRVAPQLYPIGTSILTGMVQAQQFANVQPLSIIDQLLVQNKAQGHIRNGNLYVLPLDVSAQTPAYHMKRTDPQVNWSRDADLYTKVRAFYTVRQYPIPETVLTNHDAANWTGTVTNVGRVDTSLLPAPSGASELLKSNGNCSRAGLSAKISLFDRFRVNWCPATATSMTVTLQEDANNKLVYVKTFAGGTGAGFIASGAGPTATATKDIAVVGKYVTQVMGSTTSPCSYRVTLLDGGGTAIWVSGWKGTGFANAFQVDVPASIYEASLTTTVRLEFTGLYVVGTGYGVQVTQCDIQIRQQVSMATGSHVRRVSSRTYSGALSKTGESTSTYWQFEGNLGSVPELGVYQSYQIDVGRFDVTYLMWADGGGLVLSTTTADASVSVVSGKLIASWGTAISPTFQLGQPASVQFGGLAVTVAVIETITDTVLVWQTSLLGWQSSFNLIESVDIPIAQMTKTGNPQTITTIAFGFTGDNYLDGICLVASDPQTQFVEVGAGTKVYEVREDLGSYESALSYARGLLPIVSKAREQYTRDLPLTDELGVGDTVECDGVNMTVYACEYRQDGKSIAVGKQLDTTQTLLREQSRRINALERR